MEMEANECNRDIPMKNERIERNVRSKSFEKCFFFLWRNKHEI